MHPKRISYRRIAAEAGVSYKTLYRVLNNEPAVSEATRQKIIRTMKQYGCMDGRLPAGCGVVIYIDANFYMHKYARILEKKLRDFPVTVRLFQEPADKAALLKAIEPASRLICFEYMPQHLLEQCREANPDLKVICINGSCGDINIGCDYFQQGRMAAEYFHRCGCRTLGIIREDCNESSPHYRGMHDREMGCRYGWVQEYGHEEPETISDLEACFSGKRPLPDIFFTANTYWAKYFIVKAAEHHLRLPEDYRLFTIGRFRDDVQPSEHPEIDCIYHDPEEQLDIALTFLFSPNLGIIHSPFSVNVQNHLQLCGIVREIEL